MTKRGRYTLSVDFYLLYLCVFSTKFVYIKNIFYACVLYLIICASVFYCFCTAYAQGVSESVYPAYIDKSGLVHSFLYPVELTGAVEITGIANATAISGTAAIDQQGWGWAWDASVDPNGAVHAERDSGRIKFSEAKRVGVLTHVEQISSTRWGTLIRLGDGTIWGFGHTKFGLLDGVSVIGGAVRQSSDQPDKIIPVSSPVLVPFPESIINISSNGVNALALGKSGVIYTWGVNSYGVLGANPIIATNNIGANRIKGVEEVVRVYAGRFHGYAVTTAGRVFAWGGCPQPNATDAAMPFEIEGLDGVVGLSIPYFDEHEPVFFLRRGGSVWYGSVNLASYHDGGQCRSRSDSPYDAPIPLQPVPELKGKIVQELAETYGNPNLRVLGLDSRGFFSIFADRHLVNKRHN